MWKKLKERFAYRAINEERLEKIESLVALDVLRVNEINRLTAELNDLKYSNEKIAVQTELSEALFDCEQLLQKAQEEYKELSRSHVEKTNSLIAEDVGRVSEIERVKAELAQPITSRAQNNDKVEVALADCQKLLLKTQEEYKALDQSRVEKIGALLDVDIERISTIERVSAELAELKTSQALTNKSTEAALASCRQLLDKTQQESRVLDENRVRKIYELEKLLKDNEKSYLDYEEHDSLRADELEVSRRNLDFLRDPRFAEAWEKVKKNNVEAWRGTVPDLRWRAHIAVWAATNALHVEGDFVECGVYAGLLSGTICSALEFASIKRRFFLFDTFVGIPENGTPHAGSERINEINSYYIDVRDIVRQNFAEYPNVKIVEGALPDTLRTAKLGKISYLSVDLNDAYYESQVIEALWPKITPGGVVLIDDYGWSKFTETYEMWNEFARKQGLTIACLPTGQGLLLKPHPKPKKIMVKS
jgi:O-methyltransferase